MKKSKIGIGFTLMALLMVSLMCIFGVSCADKTEVVLDNTEISLQLGDSADIKAENPKNFDLEWTVENDKIVSIVIGENKVSVTALAVGKTAVSVKVNGKTTATCNVTVEPKDFYVNLPENCLVLKKNHTASVRVLYSGTLTERLTWESSDETIATVEAQNEVAIVTAVKRGECEISVSGGGVVKTFTVIVGIT